MSDTERYIRSISFIIGIQRGMENGTLVGPMDNILDTTNGDSELRLAIRAGKAHSNFINFMLSTQSMGNYGHGGFGKLWARFKTWSSQKFGHDTRLFHWAYLQFKEPVKENENDTFDWKAMKKVFKSLVQRKKYNREMAGASANLRQFFILQGLPTLFFDILSLGVFPMLAPFYIMVQE